MRKTLLSLAVIASSIMALTACNNGDYDAYPAIDLSQSTNPLDSNNTGGGGSGGGGGNNNSFNWSGTDPMSASIDGASWQAGSASYLGTGMTYAIIGSGNGYTVTVVFPSEPVPGMEFDCAGSSGGGFSIIDGSQTSPNNAYSTQYSGSGRVRVEETAGGKIKGRFYGVVKNQAGTSRNITSGYFNAD